MKQNINNKKSRPMSNIVGFNTKIGIIAASLITVAASAQQGMGTDTPEKSSVLELKSSKRGLLVPRIKLTATNVAAPVNLPANSLLVYNTSTTSGPNGVEPGYYYWSGPETAWIRIMNQKDVETAIANVADTKVTSAELSGTTLKIKQNGVTTDVTVDLAALDTNTTYTADGTSIKLDGTTFKRTALTGDVTAAEGSSETKITKIQGKAIDASNPSTGQVLKWDGSKWAPAADIDNNTTYTGSTSVTLNGTSFERAALTGDVTAAANNNNVTVTKIQGKDIDAANPSTGQVLKWDGSKWAPAADIDNNTTYTGSTSVTLNGTTFQRAALTGDVTAAANNNNVTVTKIQGKAIDAANPTSGQVLKWDGSKWKPSDETTGTTYTADGTSIKLDGTTIKRTALTGDVEAAEGSSTTKVTKIQGQAISATAPTASGQVLKWNGSEWAPAADADTQSKETVSSGDTSIIDVTATGGPLNKDYAVKIKGAGVSETKVLQSVNGTVKWADAPAAATPSTLNTIGGTAKVVDNIEISTWGNPGDVFLCVTTTTAAIDLPDPAQYVGRIISVNNQAASATNYASNSPKNRSAITPGMGHLLMSVGVQNGSGITYRWYIVGGSY